MAEEYYSFQDVLRELQMEESELKRLVSEGEVNAINDGQNVKFAKSEIENIRNNKMDAGTIMVPSGNGESSEEVLLVDEVDSGAISAIEEVGSSVALQAELADESSAFVNIDDSGPLLSMEESQDDNQPILNISSEMKKPRIQNVKEDTEELIFEQSSGEDLLETGELLFDSVNQVLPRDREEAELFTESEMGISDDYDDIDEASVKAAIDFVDSSDEEIVSTSTPKSNIHYSSVEMQRRQKVRTMAGVSVGLLTFAVVALFFFFPPKETNKTPTVTAHVVQNITSETAYSYTGEVKPIRETNVTTNTNGTVSALLSANSSVQKGQTIAEVASSGDPANKKKYESLKRRYDSSKKTFEKNKKYHRALKKYYAKYVKTPRSKRSALDKKTKRAAKIYHTMLDYRKNGKSWLAQMKKLKSQMGGKEEIKATANGFVTQVFAKNNSQLNSGDKIYAIGEADEVLCSFRIPKGEAQNWSKDDQIEVTIGSNNYNAVVENVNEDTSTQPVTLWLHVRINNNESQIKLGEQASLKYNKEHEVMAIPRSAVYTENGKTFVFVILEDKDKVLRRDVQLGEERENGYVRVSNLYANDKIVADNTIKLEENQDVVIAKDTDK
ncbi:efflux RND transporter periplasmic adaptor subunit [Candidatus Uabimicrobium amorphum]|uniref:Acriflavin resistance protein n=1 Tax=Uabimicrobium amorphum TaxID=2596890 RepID=A0A5S9F5K8_UABAM|nr:HlyD family efflux transporter periplasmic adaptor subunit [Candidatus Uabimicrobium amorphum]BBM85362.1 acriflavin resistance protein [Candidatus Uabimicrobium amorphum]